MSLALRLAALVLTLFVAPCAVAQNTYFVTTTAPSGPGSLPAAIAAMQFNGTTQTLRFTLPAGSVITLGADLAQLTGTQVEVLGTDTPGLVIDGGGFALFRYGGQALLLRDLLLRNGRGTGAGCLSSNATLSTQVFDTQFLNCRTDGTSASGSSGGALFSFGSLRLTRTRFEGNLATDGGINNLSLGGGAVSFNGNSLLVENSTFVDNRTVRTPMPAGNCTDAVGAALVAAVPTGGSATLNGVSFTGNSHRCGSIGGAISGQGGAISIFGPTSGSAPSFAIDSSFLGGNLADNGAGIFARAVALTINNTSFHENVGRGAGAIFLGVALGGTPPPSELRLNSSTFRRNGTALPASFGADLTLAGNTVVRQIRNVLFAAPQAGESCQPATFNSDTGDVVFTTGNSCFVFVAGNPVFAQFAPGTDFGLQTPALNGGLVPSLDLAPGSVAIDNGSNTLCPPRDARNFGRPFDGDGNGVAICDVGAVEFRPQLLLRDGFE
jgi:hypothetical protein